MKFYDLQKKTVKSPVFSFNDIFKLFPNESEGKLKVQLSNWTSQGKLYRLRRGLYCLNETEIKEPFILSQLLYAPSYISLESALNYYGLIPDVPHSVTAVSTGNPRTFSTRYGTFTYRKLKGEYFFGFKKIPSEPYFFLIAEPEKSLLDFIYYKSKGIYTRDISDLRLSFPKGFSVNKLKKYASVLKSPNIMHMVDEVIRVYKD